MPSTPNCSFTSEQCSQLLLGAENRPSSELQSSGLQSRAPPRGSGCPCGRPRAFPPPGRPELGAGDGRAPGSRDTLDWPRFQPANRGSDPANRPGIQSLPRRECRLRSRRGGRYGSRFRVSRPAPTWACAFRAGERGPEPGSERRRAASL